MLAGVLIHLSLCFGYWRVGLLRTIRHGAFGMRLEPVCQGFVKRNRMTIWLRRRNILGIPRTGYREGRLTYTASNARSAGVIPLIRDACPIVSGRMRSSFCRASTRKPEIVW